jgi:hypothetical protein
MNAVVLAQDVIKYSLERSDWEKPSNRQVPETLLCCLLGLSGLTWNEQEKLPTIWLQLYQQTDKAAREMVLRTFFQDLGHHIPSF